MKGEVNPQLSFGDEVLWSRVPDEHVLVRLERALDWEPLEALLASVYPPVGRGSAPPLVCLKMLLLEQWFDLSDAACEAACRDRLSFMRFLGLGLSESVPDESALSRFRTRLREAELDARLFSAVSEQLRTRNLVIRPGVLIDASLVTREDASALLEMEASMRPARRRRPRFVRRRSGIRAWWSVLRHKLRRLMS
jgi:transposase, IS5 family